MRNDKGNSHTKRMLVAVVLSGVILVASDWASMHFFGRHMTGAKPATEVAATAQPGAAAVENAAVPGVAAVLPVSGTVQQSAVAQAAVQAVRLPLVNERIEASVNTLGGRLDEVTLKNYKNEIEDTGGFEFLKPSGQYAEYVAAGWMGAGIEGPTETSVWEVEADDNGAGKPVTLVWRNASGQAFQRIIALNPDSYVATVTEKVINTAQLPVSMTPFVQVHRADGYWPNETSSWVNYFGPMGVTAAEDGFRLHEMKYSNLKDDGKSEIIEGKDGWWGITSQYFMTAVMPGTVDGVDIASQRQFRHATLTTGAGAQDVYTASVSWPNLVIQPGQTREVTYKIYVGPKHYGQLAAAGSELPQAISWGWFEPMVKGLYAVLAWLHGYLGNWGYAVIGLTILLKIVTFPLANKSYHAMARMKKLQPQIEKMKEKNKGDQQAMATEMMALYKKEKVNPMSGCWPMLIQIPIFFAMYKVVLVMFEFRHAELGLWITDMSVHDPFFVLPILMGISMWVQFKLNPAPTDPTQAMMFKWMPAFMTVMFLWFPAGLVLYWLTNNVLSIGQQYFILKKDKAV